MTQMIEAVYEKGIFKPLSPVDLPDGARVRITLETATDPDEPIRQQLLSNGADPDEAERVLANLRLLWSSYKTLTEEQKAIVESAHLDQERFFSHPEPE